MCEVEKRQKRIENKEDFDDSKDKSEKRRNVFEKAYYYIRLLNFSYRISGIYLDEVSYQMKVENSCWKRFLCCCKRPDFDKKPTDGKL